MLVLKVRFGYAKSYLYKSTNVSPKLCMPFHLKITGTSSTDDARVKVPLFQNVTFSYNMKYSTEMPSICIFVCMLYENVSDCHD